MFKCGTSYGLQTNAQHFFQVLMQTYSISEKDNWLTERNQLMLQYSEKTGLWSRKFHVSIIQLRAISVIQLRLHVDSDLQLY